MVSAAQHEPALITGRQAAIADPVQRRAALRESSDVPGIWELLDQVADPEIPVISIWEIGVLQDIQIEDGKLSVTITPTYSGCPAMDEIAADIKARLAKAGHGRVNVKHRLAPAWTTDWMTPEGRQKLLEYGIAPPNGCAAQQGQQGDNRPASCPLCGSAEVDVVSEFGSTACKALYRCTECGEPFDYFKCL